jgi:hypothetical protein
MSKLFVDEIVHQSSQGSGTITIGASGETTNIVGTLQNNGAGVGGNMTPAFFATASSDQAFTDDSVTKVQFATEVFDTDGTYDNATNYRFTPAVAGKYQIFSTVLIHSDTGNYQALDHCIIYLYKNGSQLTRWDSDFRTGTTPSGVVQFTVSFNYVVDSNTTDYYEVFVFCDSRPSNAPKTKATATSFGAYKIIE